MEGKLAGSVAFDHHALLARQNHDILEFTVTVDLTERDFEAVSE